MSACELSKYPAVSMPTLNPAFERFIEVGPITLMAGGTAARMLHPEQLDAWYEEKTTKT